MNFRPVYLDSSAVLKLVLPERESEPLTRALQGWEDLVSSALAAIESRRALRRVTRSPAIRRRLEAVLSALTLVRIDDVVVRTASDVGAPELRTLDAIHLATALSIGDLPDAFITYDDRLAGAARALGLDVLQPGR
ncbi:MAG TPA: type II toxin-antitoxin system VapC family toxin [Vicinamibacterales bacterium]|nr:type II toxin-antitoxin system VapC family toxin [Vicinamibacterales bacterium]